MENTHNGRFDLEAFQNGSTVIPCRRETAEFISLTSTAKAASMRSLGKGNVYLPLQSEKTEIPSPGVPTFCVLASAPRRLA